MNILWIELVDFKRLAVSKIKRFRLDLKSAIQIILGCNGSGKSSILEELTPLPGSKENYRKGGSKTIAIEKEGKLYLLHSSFHRGQEHSFKVDGVELNDGGTVTIQKELVKKHFEITVESHEVMLGIEKFSNMAASRKRELLTKLCPVNYGYSIDIYKKVQEQLGISSGALKHQKKRLTQEMSKAIDADEAARIRSRVSELTKESQSMYLLREVETADIAQVESTAKDLNAKIEEWCNNWHSIRKVLKGASYLTPDELQGDLNEVQAEMAALKITYAELSSEHIKLSADTQEGDEMDDEQVMSLRERISNLKQRSKELVASRSIPLEGLKPRLARDAMASLYQPLSDAILELPVNADEFFNSTRAAELEDSIRIKEAALQNSTAALEKLRHDISHMEGLKKGDEIACPKCQHSWIVGYNETLHKAMLERQEKGGAYISEHTAKVAALKAELAQQVKYYQDYNQVTRMMRSCPELNPVWAELMAQKLLQSSPQSAITFLDRVRNDIELLCAAVDMDELCLMEARRLEHAEYALSENYKAKKARLKALEERLGYLTRDIQQKQKRCDESSLEIRRVKTMYDLQDRIRGAMNNLEDLKKDGVKAVKNSIIDESLQHVHEELAVLSVRLNSVNAHENLIADINNQIVELTKTETAWKLVQASLSPVDGLIAEGMLGFIRQFVARMNLFISQVWTYSMEVQDCSLDDETAELNYKFPVFLADIDETVPEVGRCSEGQKEMIDLAFRVVAAECWGISNGPLPLDEFGKTFDEAHREAATAAISQLIERTEFSQLFMVSHYESSWGAFYKAQVTVVNKKNITIPSGLKYNEFATMEA